MQTNSLENEWSLLQNQFDSYEKYSLLIKLASTGLLSAAYLSGSLSSFVFFLLLILWLQDAIWKTFQARIEARLLWLEECLQAGSDAQAHQYNTQYQNNRPGTFALVKEYLRQAIRPTIAFPHVLLLSLLGTELLL